MERREDPTEDRASRTIGGDAHEPAGERAEVYQETAYPEDTRLEGDEERTVQLREERLVARKDRQKAGEVVIRKEVEEVPGRLEVEAFREEVHVEHVPVGRVVQERAKPREEDGVLIIPVYEEQLVVSKRLVLREEIRVRSVGTTERQVFEDRLRKDRLRIEDPDHTGAVREKYPTEEDSTSHEESRERQNRPGLIENAFRKILD